MLKNRIQSIIDKANITTGKSDKDMTTATQSLIAGYGGGGGDIDALIEGSTIEITSNAAKVRNFAFYFHEALTSVNFPVVTSIGRQAFQGCKALTSVDFPVVTSIGENAFNRCVALASVNFPVVTSIGENAFGDCEALASVNFPVATSIGDYAFDGCKALTSVDFPVVTSIGDYAFEGCKALTSVDFPVVTSIGRQAFAVCDELKDIYLPGKQFCELSGGLGTYDTCKVHVPASLFEQYKSATNWSIHVENLVPIGNFAKSSDIAIITDNGKTKSITVDYMNFVDGTVECNASYDTSKLSVDTPVIKQTPDMPGQGKITINVTALTEPEQMEENTVSIIVSDGTGSYECKSCVTVIKTAPKPIWRVEPVEGAQYGFAKNAQGYYESQNKGVDYSYALCKIVFNTSGLYTLYLDCINYGQTYSDFGILSDIGVVLHLNYYEDHVGVFKSFISESSPDVIPVNYGVQSNGEKFITIKYIKDRRLQHYNDSLQFKVRMELE